VFTFPRQPIPNLGSEISELRIKNKSIASALTNERQLVKTNQKGNEINNIANK
jgi:hypothetical protein